MLFEPAQIPAIREEAEDALRPAFDKSHTESAGSWLDQCEADLAQLWRLGDLWVITQVQDAKTGRAILVVALAGKYTHALMSEIEVWAKSVGCVQAFFTGRKGWIRRSRMYDKRCEVVAVTVRKEL